MKDKNKEKIAALDMLPAELCGLAAMTAKLDQNNIPDDLSECQEELKKTKHLLASALGSHLVCHARLSIAQDNGKTAQKYQLKRILKECKE